MMLRLLTIAAIAAAWALPTGADPIAPYGGAAFHDNKVWIRRCAAAT